MIIVFPTVDIAEQGVGRAEGIEAIADDYANRSKIYNLSRALSGSMSATVVAAYCVNSSCPPGE